jgi:hypothetical protein
MFNENFIPAQSKTRYQKTSYMEHNFEGICNFEVYNINCTESVEVFHKAYILSRKKLFKDMEWEEWSKDNDLGYQAFLRVLESGDYKLGYYENEFSYKEPAQIRCCGELMKEVEEMNKRVIRFKFIL